jgi:hypothetical protein
MQLAAGPTPGTRASGPAALRRTPAPSRRLEAPTSYRSRSRPRPRPGRSRTRIAATAGPAGRNGRPDSCQRGQVRLCETWLVLQRISLGLIPLVLGCRTGADPIPVEPESAAVETTSDTSVPPLPRSPEEALAQAVARYGPSVAEIERVEGAAGQTLLLYSYDAFQAWLHEPEQASPPSRSRERTALRRHFVPL